jgi:hypothetical protein
MDCLDHFDGWTNESSEQVLKHTRRIIRNLKLTTPSSSLLQQYIDIDIDNDSALLVRSQIDEQYLSALIRVKTAKSTSLVEGTAVGVDTAAEEDNDCQSNNNKSSSSSWSSSTISSVGGVGSVGLPDESSRLRPAPKGRSSGSSTSLRREHRLQKTFKYSSPVINPSSSSSSSSFVAAEVSLPSIPHRPRPRRRKTKQKNSHNAEMQSIATSSSTTLLIAGHSSQVQYAGYNNCDPHYHYSDHPHQQEWHQGWWWWSENNGWQYHYPHLHPHHHYNPFYYGDTTTDDGTYHFPPSACDTGTTTTFNTGFYSHNDGTY